MPWAAIARPTWWSRARTSRCNVFRKREFLLFGDESRIEPLLAKLPRLKARATIRHTDEAISGDAKPSAALRSGRRSSMRLAIDAVAAGEAHCVVSAGNTGALMAMAKFVLQMLPGIDRPAMASFFPTRRGESVMLDLGANVECDAENLVQFALMGDVFARTVLGLRQPDRRPAQRRLRGAERQRSGARRGVAAARAGLAASASTASSRATTSPPARSTSSSPTASPATSRSRPRKARPGSSPTSCAAPSVTR